MTSADELKRQIREITVWKRGAQRAPHKPLLLLLTLGHYARGGGQHIPFATVDIELSELLLEFGPDRSSLHPEYPFWRLQNDGIWELENAEHVVSRQSNTDAKRSELLEYGVTGGLTGPIYQLLTGDLSLISEIAAEIMVQHFPDTWHSDLLKAIGLERQFDNVIRRRRDASFRSRVLAAYGFRCAICGYDLRLGKQQIALEAAHIKWHQSGGPDVEPNGLALCSMHHKLFDRGAFTLGPNRRLFVSQKVHGTTGLNELLMPFHGRSVLQAQSMKYFPAEEYLAWHRKEVFRGPERDSAIERVTQ